MKPLVRLALGVVLIVMMASCGPQDTPVTTAGDVQMTLRVEPEALAVGDTTLIVTLKDAAGQPIDGATLTVHGNMDHEGMMPVDRETSDSTDGEYRVPFMWTMGGGWIVTVTATLPDNRGDASQSFEFFVEAVSSESIINQHGGTTTPEASGDKSHEKINIIYQPDNNLEISGDSAVTISLSDEAGRPITDAIVAVTGDMPGECMMSYSWTGTHTENGHYRVPLHWATSGDWQMTVHVRLSNGSSLERVFDQYVTLPAN